MHNDVNTLFEKLWDNYLEVTPSAVKVHELLGSTQQDDVINDHIALRTFNLPKVGLEKLAAHFLAVGYKECGEYHFEAKKLYAKHYEHSNPTQPKVFISELLVEKCSEELQKVVHQMVEQIEEDAVTADNFLYSGTHWQVSHEMYKTLLEESEYAAWMAAWGYRANHFTVSINHLAQFDTIEQVNQKLKDAGFALNTSGGEIKGSPEVLLEQSSTLADDAKVAFSDGEYAVPSCFYEFALRYLKPDGEIYTGFVAASADKIFESTNAR
ncbi:2-oxoadipate dioxygenase/decarboxylase family protein [Pseudoalteromonas sp. GB56]